MDISLIKSGAKGFQRWSAAHQPHSNDDAERVARVEALAIAAFGSGYAADDSTRGVACSMARARGG